MKVSILTIFYRDNSKDFFLRYLDSINDLICRSEVGGIEINVFILDNSPTPVLFRYLSLNNTKSIYKNIFLFHKNINGFAPGNNYLFKESLKTIKSDFVLMLNPDIEIYPDCLNEMIKVMNKYENTFLVDAKQYPIEHPKEYDINTLETSWCSGACLLARTDVFNIVDGFDDNFFMYAEDVDLSWRAWEMGYRCLYAPKALCVHHYFGLEKNGSFRQFWSIRNGVIMRFKHGTLLDILIFSYLVLKTSLEVFDEGRFKEVLNIAKAYWAGLENFNKYYIYLFKIKIRPDFAKFFKYEYARIRNTI